MGRVPTLSSPNSVTNPPADQPSLYDALSRGGVHRGLKAADKRSALQSAITYLALPDGMDEATFLEMLMAREAEASSGVGDGIALPHVRTPSLFQNTPASITLCFLDAAVDFGAPDGKPVSAMFLLITPNSRQHLHVLSRLARALQNREFRGLIHAQAPAEAILEKLAAVESARPAAPGAR